MSPQPICLDLWASAVNLSNRVLIGKSSASVRHRAVVWYSARVVCGWCDSLCAVLPNDDPDPSQSKMGWGSWCSCRVSLGCVGHCDPPHTLQFVAQPLLASLSVTCPQPDFCRKSRCMKQIFGTMVCVLLFVCSHVVGVWVCAHVVERLSRLSIIALQPQSAGSKNSKPICIPLWDENGGVPMWCLRYACVAMYLGYGCVQIWYSG